MRRVLTALLFGVTIVVIAATGYVVVHDDPVPAAGQTPGYSPAPARTASTGRSTASGGPSSGTASPRSIRAAFIGDNYTVGQGASAGRAWVPLVVADLQLGGRRFGVAGGGYAKRGADGRAYSAVVADVIADKPDLVVVSGGRNDVGDDVQTLREQTAALFARLHGRLPDATLVAVAPWWGDSPHPDALAAVDSAVKDAVAKVGGTYLDLPDPLRDHPEYMADAANPNDKGYAAIATAVEQALKPELPS